MQVSLLQVAIPQNRASTSCAGQIYNSHLEQVENGCLVFRELDTTGT
jgi:hypothetical protein